MNNSPRKKRPTLRVRKWLTPAHLNVYIEKGTKDTVRHILDNRIQNFESAGRLVDTALREYFARIGVGIVGEEDAIQK